MEWQCQKCSYQRTGKEDGFKCLGKGIIVCPQCGTRHFVQYPSGELVIMQENGLFNKILSGKEK